MLDVDNGQQVSSGHQVIEWFIARKLFFKFSCGAAQH